MKTTLTSISMDPSLKENSQSGSAVKIAVGISLALLASFLLFQYVYGTGLTKSIVAKSKNVAAAKTANVSAVDLATAFSKEPLSQNLVNAGLVLKSDEISLEERARWIGVIRKMGWRSTAAMQTLIAEAATKRDLSDIIVVADALLRRRKLFDETVSLMLLLESEPSTRDAVYTRLKNQVPWRSDYLQAAGSMNQTSMLQGRLRTLLRLQEAGTDFSRAELAHSLADFVKAGKIYEGF